jgi:RND family efflux transporter MFP subunit
MITRLLVTLALFATAVRAQDWHDGLCEAKVDASLSFPVGGVLAKVLVKEGEQVKAGQPLLELENDIETLEVKRQELAVEAARKDFDRTKNAFSRGGSITQEELDQKEAVWQISIVEKQQAESQLKRRQLLSPSDGVVEDLFQLDRGEAVAPNTPAVRVVNRSECLFTCYVKGDTKHGCEEGKAVEIVLFTETGEVTMAGKIEFVSGAIDAGSGLRRVRAAFSNPEGKIASGTKGKLRLKAAP